MNSDLRFFARRDSIFYDGISLHCYTKTSDSQPAVALPMIMRVRDKSEEGTECPQFMHLSPEAAQRLVDELWNCGVRPSEGTGSAGSLAATQRHLDDMRAIVAATLTVDLPKK